MPELPSVAYERARPLFGGLERTHALVTALFEDQLTARLFVDDMDTPRSGLLVCNSRVICAGDATAIDFVNAMMHCFADELIPAKQALGDDAYLVCFSEDTWKATLKKMFSAFQIYHGERQYYEITDCKSDVDVSLPAGFTMQLITPEFLASDVAGLTAVREEMCSERLSVDDFLAHSFGLCPVYENEVVGWCMSEYNVGTRCEIGIATAEKHQRRGLATLTTRAFLAEAHQRGYTRVGWDCWAQNAASGASARKAGFKLIETYPAVVAVF